MIDIVQFTLLGLGIGALYALITQGLVLVFRGSGVLNFAQGAFVMVGAYAHYELYGVHHLPAWLSITCSAAIGAVVGALTHLVILRPMRKSSALTRVVATLGLLITLQAAAVLRYGVDVKSVPSSLPTRRVEFIDGAPIGLDRLILFGIAVVITAALWLLYRSTAFGRTTRAVAESRRATSALGHSPDRVAVINWALGGALAALAGCLIAPITFLQPTALVLLVVPALAAGLLAGYSSFPIALLGALGIGVAQSLMSRYVDNPGWTASVPFIAVILLLVVRGRGLPLRSDLVDRLPLVGAGRVRPIPVAVAFVGMTVLMLWVLPVRWVDAFSVTLGFAILCLAVVVVTGFAGQLALSLFVLAGVGALVAARASRGWGWPFPLAVCAAVVVTMALGAIVSLPALRTRGLNLAIVTFGLATVIFALILNDTDLTNGDRGIRVRSPSIFGWSIDPVRHPGRYGFVIVVAVFALGLMICNLRRGAIGRRLVAVRSNERAAAAAGVNVYITKVYAFVVASAIAAIAGVFMSFRNSIVIADQFAVFPSITIVAMTVVGGVGFVGGGFIGALLMQGGVGSELLRSFHGIERYLPLAGGIILLYTLYANQDGAWAMNVHLAEQARARLERWRAARHTSSPRARIEAAMESSTVRRSELLQVAPKVLGVDGLTIRFGGVTAVNDVSIEVRPGEIHGLIGPNGAGKTTVIDAITGFVKPNRGRITLDGHNLTRSGPRRRAHAGVTRSFQSLELFNDLTVAENLAVASDRASWRRYLLDLVRPGRLQLTSAVEDLMDQFELLDDRDSKPESLPYGRRRMVAIARAVSSAPSIILLDEPASGLSDVEVDELARYVRRLAHECGMGVLLIEHNIDLILDICDRVTVMATGAVLTTGSPEEIRHNPDVLAAYIGAVEPDEIAEAVEAAL